MSVVGQKLAEYGSGLNSTVEGLVMTGINAYNTSFNMALQRTKEILQLPASKLSTYILFTDNPQARIQAGPGGNDNQGGNQQDNAGEGVPASQFRLMEFNMLIPTFILINNEPFVVDKFLIKSSWEAAINKHFGTQDVTETKASTGSGGGFLGLFPKINIDINNKLTIDYSNDESEKADFEFEMSMSPGRPAVGYIKLVNCFVKCVEACVNYMTDNGIQGAAIITKEQADELNKQADVPIIPGPGVAPPAEEQQAA